MTVSIAAPTVSGRIDGERDRVVLNPLLEGGIHRLGSPLGNGMSAHYLAISLYIDQSIHFCIITIFR